MTHDEIYKKRHIPEGATSFSNPVLNDFLFGLSEVTLVAAGLSSKVQKHWVNAMLANKLPTLNYEGKDIEFVSWMQFEAHVQAFYERKKNTLRIKRGMRNLPRG